MVLAIHSNWHEKNYSTAQENGSKNSHFTSINTQEGTPGPSSPGKHMKLYTHWCSPNGTEARWWGRCRATGTTSYCHGGIHRPHALHCSSHFRCCPHRNVLRSLTEPVPGDTAMEGILRTAGQLGPGLCTQVVMSGSLRLCSVLMTQALMEAHQDHSGVEQVSCHMTIAWHSVRTLFQRPALSGWWDDYSAYSRGQRGGVPTQLLKATSLCPFSSFFFVSIRWRMY